MSALHGTLLASALHGFGSSVAALSQGEKRPARYVSLRVCGEPSTLSEVSVYLAKSSDNKKHNILRTAYFLQGGFMIGGSSYSKDHRVFVVVVNVWFPGD